jgi:membrane protease YdiL (CAAX protease family)
MSVRARQIDIREGALTGVLIATGCLALVLRAAVVGTSAALPMFVAVLAAIAVVSIATPVGRIDVHRLPTPLVLALGAGAVLAATLIVGPALPLRAGAGALLLGVAAAVSEELFFRRLVYGRLERIHTLVAIVGSALVFALVHIPLYGAPVFWVDLGAGLLFSWQRWASGGWGASAGTHAFANVLAVIR